MGRKQFCIEHGINLDSDEFSVQDFIKMTHNEYGGQVIRNL